MNLPHGIKPNIPLANKTWFKTGGIARFYTQPTDEQAFQTGIAFAQSHQLPIFILGEGANILISDEGFNGVVIHPSLDTINIEKIDSRQVLVTAGAGVSFGTLIRFCLDHAILGLEEFSGIPGTVGGAVYINLHYFEFLLEHFLQSARIIEKQSGTILTVDKEWFTFGYNQSRLQQEDHFLVDATFKLAKGSPFEMAYAQGRSTEIIRHRNKRYPTQATCGSFFRNFFEHEVALEEQGKKVIFVGYYLDKVGIKGKLRVGDAQVSYQHANMIVNNGTAQTADIISLACSMQERVQREFGITPQPECRLIGFKEYPLLR